MKIEYDLAIPKSDAEDVNALYNFAESSSKTMQITYENDKVAGNRRSVLARAIENKELKMAIKRIGEVVYVEKI